MNSKILSALSFDLGILIIALFILLVVLFVYVLSLQKKQELLEKKYRTMMRGSKGAKALDEALENKIESLNMIKDSNDAITERMTRIDRNMGSSYKKLGIVKYDAFKEMGGKLSFALCLLNDRNDGFVMNSIHSKEGCYNYVKEIIKGESFLPLGEEEAEALDKAIFENPYDVEVEYDYNGKCIFSLYEKLGMNKRFYVKIVNKKLVLYYQSNTTITKSVKTINN